MSVLGIDFGSENCYIASVRSGGVEILSTDTGQRAFPSYIGFGDRNRTFGSVAKSAHVTNVKNTIFGFKRLIGRKFTEDFVQNETTYLPYPIREMQDGTLGIKASYVKKDTVFSMQQLTAMLLVKLKESAEVALSTKVSNCVLSVPSYFNDSARRAILDAGRISGLNILKLMNESAAVALSYGFYKQNLSEDRPITVVFVDIGHSSLQVSICAITKSKLKVLSTASDTEVGGRDFDNSIVRHFVEDFKTRYKLDVLSNERAVIRLLTECEKLKKHLSANPKPMPLHIECFMDDIDIRTSLGRDEMEKLCSNLMVKIENTMRRALAEAKLHFADISSVELVGGSSRIPAIKQLVQKVFRCEPSTTLNLDEAVARGCALQCALLSPSLKVKEFHLLDIQPYPIRLIWSISKGEQGEIEVFPKNHQVPFSKFLTYFRTEQFTLNAHYGTTKDSPSEETLIGSFKICNVTCSSSGESSKVQVKARVNIHGIFSICSAVVLDRDCNETDVLDQRAEDHADLVGSFGISQSGNQEEVKDKSEKKQKKSSKVVELNVQKSVPEMSVNEISQFIEEELTMAEMDRAEKERADARNELEEFVYQIRSSVSNELRSFIQEKTYSSFMERLDRVENWLYEDGDGQDKNIFMRELSELKETIEPVIIRKTEHYHRLEVIDEFRNVLRSGYKIVDLHSTKDSEYANLDPNEVEQLHKVLNQKSEWLDQQLSALPKDGLCKNPSVLAETILNEKESLLGIINRLVNKSRKQADFADGENVMK